MCATAKSCTQEGLHHRNQIEGGQSRNFNKLPLVLVLVLELAPSLTSRTAYATCCFRPWQCATLLGQQAFAIAPHGCSRLESPLITGIGFLVVPKHNGGAPNPRGSVKGCCVPKLARLPFQVQYLRTTHLCRAIKSYSLRALSTMVGAVGVVYGNVNANESQPLPADVPDNKFDFDFPEAVMEKLKAAAKTYGNDQVDPLTADQLWREALEAAAAHGMDPMSLEVLGMTQCRLRALEEAGLYARAIEIAEQLHRNCQAVIDEAEWPKVALDHESRTATALLWLILSQLMLMDFRAGDPVLDYDAVEEARGRLVNWAVQIIEDRRTQGNTQKQVAHLTSTELGGMMLGYVGSC